MKKILLVLLILTCSIVYSQQTNDKKYSKAPKFKFKNALEIEIFGHGGNYSLNYERLFINRNRYKLLVQIGAACYPEYSNMKKLFITSSIFQLISFNKHHIEFGIGQINTNETDISLVKGYFYYYNTFELGYRYQKPDGRFLFKIDFAPVLIYPNEYDQYFYGAPKVRIQYWGGMTFGFNF